MKRKYVIAVLLLLGLGVVSTLAFTLGDLDDYSVAGPVSITQTGTGEDIDEVHVYPYQHPDGMYIKITLGTSVTSSYEFSVTIEDGSGPIDISSATFSYKLGGTWTSATPSWDGDLGAATITASGSGTDLKLRISGITDLYTDAVTLLIYEQSLT